MSRLHIVQGGIENGDKKWLEKAAREKLSSRSWIVPRSATVGDEVVIYVSGYGFFATAKINTRTKPRTDWKNRYGAGLNSIRLIQPAISLANIRRHVPKLTWAKGVQSLTELVNRSATKAFTFGLIEVAIYKFGSKRIAIQPRVLAETESITRQVTIVNNLGDRGHAYLDDDTDEPMGSRLRAPGNGRGHLREWWEPIVKMSFDDPEQEPPRWTGTNNISLATPYPGIQIKAYAMTDGTNRAGVYVTGTRTENVVAIEELIKRDKRLFARQPAEGHGH